MPSLTSLDHLVLTVRSIERTAAFYESVLGMTTKSVDVADGTTRMVLKFGSQMIELHSSGAQFGLKAKAPTSGSADLCFLSQTPVLDWVAHLAFHDLPIEDGPIAGIGAVGAVMSIYLRDPDGNLIQIANAV